MSIEGIYGRTGEIGRDGLLAPEQAEKLNQLQEKAANNCVDYLDRMTDGQEYPLVAMATGFGKGNIIHRIIEKQVREKPDSKILLIAGTKLVLVKQTHEALSGYQQQTINTDAGNGNGFGYISSEEDDEAAQEATDVDYQDNPLENETSFLYTTGKIRRKDVNVHVATIQTMQSELQKGSLNPEDYDLVIVDEAHNIGTEKRKRIVEQFTKVVGFTATPTRYSGRMKTPEQYGFKVIESLTLPEAQELRLLPPLVGIQIDTTSVLKDKIPTTITGLIDYKKLEKLLKDSPNLRPYIADRLANIISQDGRNYKTVIAVNFVWEAQELAELLKEKGIKVGIAVNQQAARALDSEEIPALDSIERYKLPEGNDKGLQVLISPYVLGEGFDAPTTEVLVWASPTDSYLRYTQYTGRLARRWEGKRFGVIVDCLYQTSQYNWSYNMGMWMKDKIRVLDNGLLYLGPETDIENLKTLPQVDGLQRKSAKMSLEELQKEGLLEVQETDFPITQQSFRLAFSGGWRKLRSIAEQIINEAIKENPTITVKRLRHTNVITVITDKDWFISAMLAKGVKPNAEPDTPQDTDFLITRAYVNSIFAETSRKNFLKAQEIARRLIKERPELIKTKQNKAKNGHAVPVLVCTDKDLFINAMLDAEAKLKSPGNKVQNGYFEINQITLLDIFLSGNTLVPLAKRVVLEMRATNPGLIHYGRNKNTTEVITLLNEEVKSLFIKRMQQEGARLRSNIETIRPTDFAVTDNSLKSVFVGGYPKLNAIAEEILEELRQENSSFEAERSTVDSAGKRHKPIKVATDRERFIQEMLKRGAKLRPSN